MQSEVFVDKTLLLKDFICDAGMSILMTMLRRCGKTTNLTMMKYFFGLEVDKDGREIEIKEDHLKYRIFYGDKTDSEGNPIGNIPGKQFKKLNIAEYESMKNHFAKYPVVYIDYKNIHGNYKQVLIKFKLQLKKTFISHEYLLQNVYGNLKDRDIEGFKKYTDDYADLNDAEVADGLQFLCQLLHNHFGKKCLVFLDEYDVPLYNAYLTWKNNNDEDTFEEIHTLFKGVNGSTFKGNIYMHKGLITGLLRIAEVGLFSGLNNLTEYDISNVKYSRHYLFNSAEVKYLADKYNVNNEIRREIKNWYNGYKIGHNDAYVPWSIIRCLNGYDDVSYNTNLKEIKSDIIKNYWEQSTIMKNLSSIMTIDSIREKIGLLLEGKSITFVYDPKITPKDFITLKNSSKGHAVNKSINNVFFSLFYDLGYLTKDTFNINKYKLPNNEIKNEVEKLSVSYIVEVLGLDLDYIRSVSEKLEAILNSTLDGLEKATKEFKEEFEKLLKKLPEFQNISKASVEKIEELIGLGKEIHVTESFIQTIFFLILYEMRVRGVYCKELSVKSHMTEKKGTVEKEKEKENIKEKKELKVVTKFSDLVLYTEKKCLVIEIKYSQEKAKGRPFPSTYRPIDALNQIIINDYAKTALEISGTILMGFSVSVHKEVEVLTKEFSSIKELEEAKKEILGIQKKGSFLNKIFYMLNFKHSK